MPFRKPGRIDRHTYTYIYIWIDITQSISIETGGQLLQVNYDEILYEIRQMGGSWIKQIKLLHNT